MTLYSEYYRRRLDEQATRLIELDKYRPRIYYITGKKRKYEESMGYPIDSDNEMIREPNLFNLNEEPR
jgi:hypothetical protein